ncbi:MAG: hypothetical protein SOW21_09190 [[Actinobacillus] rossii]|uniref:hypothetical protein n=1 Tax=Pasteurella multocida TaxID=747 RepID=UPI002A7E2F93|nr:hypothetical protein [[Actinobacillus] rossii]MDY3124524.1 hypothetical protein [[Actinobacillus] rossii]MDY4506323.1 hypothetical protein [[Actinobacillus] rossii]
MELSMVLRFDKLRFVKKVQSANWDDKSELAETLADALDEALEQSQNELLTKTEFKQAMAELRSDFKVEMANLEARLMTTLNSTMYKMAGLIIASVGVLMSLMKFIN